MRRNTQTAAALCACLPLRRGRQSGLLRPAALGHADCQDVPAVAIVSLNVDSGHDPQMPRTVKTGGAVDRESAVLRQPCALIRPARSVAMNALGAKLRICDDRVDEPLGPAHPGEVGVHVRRDEPPVVRWPQKVRGGKFLVPG